MEAKEMLTDTQIEQFDIIYPDGLYCHQCGNRGIYLESFAEGYSCSKCGSSDSDE